MIFLLAALVSTGPARASEEPETRRYEVDTGDSRAFVFVRRAGLLRGAGHDHVVAVDQLTGQVTVGPEGSLAELEAPLRELAVDRPADRERYGLDPEVSESSIRGTTRNMLDKVLHVDEYPDVIVTAEPIAADMLRVSVGLHGATSVYEVPVELSVDDASLTVSGSVAVRHTDFGMRPFRAAVGLLRVADELTIDFRVVAYAEDRPAAAD